MNANDRIKLLRCACNNCFACRKGQCQILTQAITRNCPFFKTVQKAVSDRTDALKRIKSLEPGERDYILCKYYTDYHMETKNKKDWLKGAK